MISISAFANSLPISLPSTAVHNGKPAPAWWITFSIVLEVSNIWGMNLFVTLLSLTFLLITIQACPLGRNSFNSLVSLQPRWYWLDEMSAESVALFSWQFVKKKKLHIHILFVDSARHVLSQLISSYEDFMYIFLWERFIQELGTWRVRAAMMIVTVVCTKHGIRLSITAGVNINVA